MDPVPALPRPRSHTQHEHNRRGRLAGRKCDCVVEIAGVRPDKTEGGKQALAPTHPARGTRCNRHTTQRSTNPAGDRSLVCIAAPNDAKLVTRSGFSGIGMSRPGRSNAHRKSFFIFWGIKSITVS